MSTMQSSRSAWNDARSDLSVGVSRIELPRVGLGRPTLGWGRTDLTATACAYPLHARAMVIAARERNARVAIVTIELAMLSDRFVDRVAELLRIASPELAELPLLVLATHNHSGPSGFTGYAMFDLPSGFDPELRDALARAVVSAITVAHAALEPATLDVGTSTLSAAAEFPRNRSMRSFRANAEVRGRAADVPNVDRDITSLIARDRTGRIFGTMHFLGVHDTCVHADVGVLHPDAKGLASARLEKRSARGVDPRFREDAVALFAQGAAADVSPNVRWDDARGFLAGEAHDDFGHAGRSAEHHYRAALASIADARRIGARDLFVTDSNWASEDEEPRALLGLSMALGTDEGPGPAYPLRRAFEWIARARHRSGAIDPRVPLVEVDRGLEGRVFGAVRLESLTRSLAPVAELARYLHRDHPRDGTAPDRWVPPPASLRFVQLGELLLVGVPFEVSTMAARRIRTACAHLTDGPVIVAGYAASYNGYLTTREEFEQQEYEGASTLYGAATLDAVLAACGRLPAPSRPTRSARDTTNRIGGDVGTDA